MRAKLIVLGFVALLAPIVAWGEEPQKLAAGEVLRGTFVQERVLQGFDGPLRSEGEFVLAPDQGLIWRTEKPFAITTLMSPAGLAQQSNGATTLNVPASRAPIMAGLYDMLTGALAGNSAALEKDFTVARSDGDGKWQLRLTSRQAAATDAMPISEIRVWGGAFVDKVEVDKQGGDLDRLIFSAQKRDTAGLTRDEKTLLESVGRQ